MTRIKAARLGLFLLLLSGLFYAWTGTYAEDSETTPRHKSALRIAAEQGQDADTFSREEHTAYFRPGSAELSPVTKQKFDILVDSLRGNAHITGVRIIGYADRLGDAHDNEKLSRQRAEAVQHYLVGKGLINAHLADTRWVGSRVAQISCPAQLQQAELDACLQRDRRVEIEIDYASDLHAANPIIRNKL
jgi:outer membrane protein OmpA-like peptidoglycan-associated protein